MKKMASIKEYIEQLDQIRQLNKLNYSLLFRGQADSSWTTQSTLERTGIAEIQACFKKSVHGIFRGRL